MSITNPVVMILSLLWDTTAAIIRHIAVMETTGSTSFTLDVLLPNNRLTSMPSMIGIRTTCTIDRSIALTSTATDVRRYRYVKNGVRSGASKVLTLVIPTDRAVSPFERNVMTLHIVILSNVMMSLEVHQQV